MLATLRSIARARQQLQQHPQHLCTVSSSTTAAAAADGPPPRREPHFYPLEPPPATAPGDASAAALRSPALSSSSPLHSAAPSHSAYEAAADVAARLRAAGHAAVIAGGWVRDTLLLQHAAASSALPPPPLPPADVDVAAAAPLTDVLRVFGHATDLPRGTLRLHHMGHAIEVSRLGAGPEGRFFERGGGGGRGGGGEQEQDGSEAEAAAAAAPPPLLPPSSPPASLPLPLDEMRYSAMHRDFTVNALFYDPYSRRVVDFVGGVEDLRRRTLRLVVRGEAGEDKEESGARRLAEDPLRCLRGVRFAAQLGLALDGATARHLRDHSELCGPSAGVVPCRRVKQELRKLASPALRAVGGGSGEGASNSSISSDAWPSAVRLMYHLGLLRALFPWLRSDADARRAALAAGGGGGGGDRGLRGPPPLPPPLLPLPPELRVAGLVNPSLPGGEGYDALAGLYYDAPEERANVSMVALAAELARGDDMTSGGGGGGGGGADGEDDDDNDDNGREEDPSVAQRWARVYAHDHGMAILGMLRAWMPQSATGVGAGGGGLFDPLKAAFEARHARRVWRCERSGALAEARAALARERAARAAAAAAAQEEERWRAPRRGW
jgi:hypothetical protein